MPRPFLLAVSLVAIVGFSAHCAERKEDWHRELATPSPEFSQMPFWFWNDDLDDLEIARQMAEMRAQGVFGFVIHARMGLPNSIAYMGERWLAHVKFAVEEAARTGMRVCLYDEGMYPSGSAHGAVVRSNPSFAAQGLAVTTEDLVGPREIEFGKDSGLRVATVIAKGNAKRGKIDLEGAIVLGPEGGKARVPTGPWCVMSFAMVPTGGHIRGVHFDEESGRPNAPPAADLLNPEAMRAFLRFAYEPYRQTVGEHFGRTVIAMFTDEPSLAGKGGRRGLKPWTGGLERYFEKQRGYALVPLLPALFYDVGDRTAQIRADFERTVAERLDAAYYEPLSRWCAEHGIALTGHPAGSDEIGPLRLFQLPGQDLVWRYVVPDGRTALEGAHSTTAKCSSSVARHDRRRRNANEVYGAYGWNLTMDEMKWLADWLIVRGVNLLCPHAFYYSIRDQRAGERPPDLGMHNAWWLHYRQFADYTSRLCGLVTDSEQVCQVAVLSTNNRLPWRAAKWLLQHQIDFNYVEAWRLTEGATARDGRLCVGPMAYRTLIVDEDRPLSDGIASQLKAIAKAGVLVRYCTGEPTAELVAGLDHDLLVDPPCPDLRSAHVVKRGIHFYLLVNEGEQPIEGTISCSALGRAEWFDAWQGRFAPAPAISSAPRLAVPLRLERRESLVLAIAPAAPAVVSPSPNVAAASGSRRIEGPWTVRNGEGKQVAAGLGDWRQTAELSKYAGTLRYEARFEADCGAACRLEIRLGAVGDWAVVRLNGKDLGPRFWSPFVWDVSDCVRDGANELVVEVANSLANRYEAKESRVSGLLGPVELRAYPTSTATK